MCILQGEGFVHILVAYRGNSTVYNRLAARLHPYIRPGLYPYINHLTTSTTSDHKVQRHNATTAVRVRVDQGKLDCAGIDIKEPYLWP